MKKLKLKFWRVENVVLMKVLQQDDSTREGLDFTASNGFSIMTEEMPELFENSLYVRGVNDSFDTTIAVYDCETTDRAIKCLNRAVQAVKEYNATLDCDDVPEEDQIDIAIAE